MQEPVVEVDTTVAAPEGRVWQAMMEGAMFPGTDLETDWKVGHPIVLRGEWQGRAFVDRGEVRSITKDRELVLTHWSDKDGSGTRPASYHVVRFTLEPDGDRTTVKLTQFNEGADVIVDEQTKAEFKKNWALMLDGLRQAAEGSVQH